MKDLIFEKVVSYMETWDMVRSGDTVVVGVSGGADSVCLLFLLYKLSLELELQLKVVHVHHGIRKEAQEDADYVRSLCERWGIDYSQRTEDVPSLSKQWGCSEETAGRRVRYEAFARCAEEVGPQQKSASGKNIGRRQVRVAVAHNLQDNAETVLQHLFRGSGLRGLTGITPKSEREGYTLIRPLLCLSRTEIEEVLCTNGIAWREDSTNQGDDYTRNKIRHNILPVAEEMYPGVVQHIHRAAEDIAVEESFLGKLTREAYEQCAARGPKASIRISVEHFAGYDLALQKRMVLMALEEVSPTGRDIGQIQIMQVLALLQQEGNRVISLPFEITAERSYGTVLIAREALCEKGTIESQDGDVILGTGQTACEDLEMEQRMLVPSQWEGGEAGFLEALRDPHSQLMTEQATECTKWFDYDKIGSPLVLRTRKTGDYLYLADGRGGYYRQTVKQYMINEKIPAKLRDGIPLVACGERVLWIYGYRMDDAVKLSVDTQHILEVTLGRKEEKDG